MLASSNSNSNSSSSSSSSSAMPPRVHRSFSVGSNLSVIMATDCGENKNSPPNENSDGEGGGGKTSQRESHTLPSSIPSPPPLSLSERISYGLGHVLNDLVASCWFSYLLVFLRSVLQIPPIPSGALLLIGQIADGIATPLVGILSDNSDSVGPIGRRRFWISMGSLMVALTFPPIFHSPPNFLNEFTEICGISLSSMAFIYFSLVIIFFQFAWASVQINHLSMVPELSNFSSERVILNSIRSVATILSNVTVFALAAEILKDNDTENGNLSGGLNENDAEKFSNLANIIVAIGGVSSAVFFLGVRDPPIVRKNRRVSEWRGWLKNSQFYSVGFVYMATRLMVNVSQTYFPMYVLFTMQMSKESIAWVPLSVFGSGFVATCLCDKMTAAIGSERLTLSALLTAVCTAMAFFTLPMEWAMGVYPLAVIWGFSCGVVGVSALSLICSLLHPQCESSAFVFGAMSFADKIANGLAIMIVQMLSSNIQSNADALFYRQVLLFGPGGAAAVGAILLTIIIQKEKKKEIHRHTERETERDGENTPLIKKENK